VFSGLEGNYTEKHLHDCTDDYGKSKSLGENNKLTMIRTSVIGEENCNKKSLIEWAKSQHSQSVNGYTNHFWNGVTCLELGYLIEKIIIEKSYWTGLRHVFSPEIVNKSQLLSMINETYKLNLTITDVEVNLCDRSLSTIYNEVIDKPLSQQIIEQANYLIN
jgi:dTDP-4-dehydrorhamnose reductase